MKKTAILTIMVIAIAFALVSCKMSGKSTKQPGQINNEPISHQRGGTINPAPNPAPAERTAKNNVMLEKVNVGGMKESDITAAIRQVASQTDVQPADAKLSPDTWEVASVEKSGKKVNVEETLNNVLNAAEGETVKLAVQPIAPGVTADGLKQNIVERAVYSTPVLDKSDGRVKNIELASSKINGKKLAPGEEFSFNRTVGKRTEEKGYEEAPIIIKTPEGYDKGNGVGGGICQISTTIYNAVEKAGLEVTERHEHSKDVGYVPPGKDATVSYGGVDFKFKNTRPYPVMLRVGLVKGNLRVRILENRNF